MNRLTSRRAFVQSFSAGLGSIALANEISLAQGVTRTHTPKARHNIVLFMQGGPSQMDLFDPKPALEKYAGQQANLRTERTTGGIMPSPFKFRTWSGRH